MTVMDPGDDLPLPVPPQPELDLTDVGQVSALVAPARLTAEQVTAFSTFYRAHVERVAAFLRWQGAGQAEAADAVQEAMIKTFERWSRLCDLDRPDAWVRTVASKEFMRRRTRSREDPSDDLPEVHTSLLRDGDDDGYGHAAEQQEQLQVLRLLEQLPPRQRQVMAWRYDGYTPTEIATHLEITSEAVRSNLWLARRTLARLVSPDALSPNVRGPGKDQP